MLKEKLELTFKNRKKHRVLKIATVFMFFALSLEKLLSGASLSQNGDYVDLYFSLSKLDIICILVYASTCLLLITRAEYKYLLLPDGVLLLVKLYTAFSGISYLMAAGKHTLLGELNAYEKTIEAFLFASFLIILFIGKLSHRENKFTKNYALFCILFLILCFPATLFFEILKIFERIHIDYEPMVIIFNFAKRLLGEIFLDIPYFLLCLTLGFTKHKHP